MLRRSIRSCESSFAGSFLAHRSGIQECVWRSRLYSASSSSAPLNNEEISLPKNAHTSQRRRHRFNFNTEEIPSFHDFQVKVKVRRLFRQFMRLSDPVSNPRELKEQIRREFRASGGAGTIDSWHVKRALSEGTRRYKELSAMLSTMPTGKSSSSPSTTSTTSTDMDDVSNHSEESIAPWPWQRNEGEIQMPRPSPSKFGSS
jgi:hypothetical protein